MKQLLFIALTFFVTTALHAQHETLFSKARVIGGFGGPILEFGNIKGDFVTSVGGGGGVIIDEFFIGAYGMGSVENFRYNFNDNDFRMDLTHGGLWLGYTPNSFKIFHPYISTKIGWGFADFHENRIGVNFTNGDGIFVLVPEAGLELNLTKFFRMTATVGYRWVNDVDQLEDYSDKDFRSITGQLTFRFGWFGKRRIITDYEGNSVE
jgi:hypothetical protein